MLIMNTFIFIRLEIDVGSIYFCHWCDMLSTYISICFGTCTNIYICGEYVFSLLVLMRKQSSRSERGGPQALPGGAKPGH
jgi:hypothetical protein